MGKLHDKYSIELDNDDTLEMFVSKKRGVQVTTKGELKH